MRRISVSVILLIVFFAIISAGIALSKASSQLTADNLKIVQELQLGKTYKFPNSFGLSDTTIKQINSNVSQVICNNGQIIILQKSTGIITNIFFADPSVKFYDMEIGKTQWQDSITENSYRIGNMETSPDGRTAFKNYKPANNEPNIIYTAVFQTKTYKDPLILTGFEKKLAKNP